MSESAIRPATLRDMAFFLSAAQAEGWNPGLSDAAPFYFSDPCGFFIEERMGEAIGCISAVAHTDAYGFIGFYIVLPQFRHQGYGILLWNRALERLGKRAIGLDGVIAQQANYRKSGFVFECTNIRFAGRVKGKREASLCPLDAIPFEELAAFDAAVCGFNRSTFLQHWISMPRASLWAKRENGALAGYGVIRKCIKGYKIGPLFAKNGAIANDLFLSLAEYAEGEEVFLDVSEMNPQALSLAKQHQLKPVFETARMYKGTPPLSVPNEIYGITSFEIG